MKRLVLATVVVMIAGGVATAQELRLLNAFDGRYPPTKIIVQKYIDTVEQGTGGKVKFRMSGPEVVGSFQQFEPVTKGAFDLHFTVQPYHVGTTSVSLGIYTLQPDPEAFRRVGIFDHLVKEYERFNLRLLAILPGSGKSAGAFHATLREPVGPSGDLQGRRVRGNAYFRPFIEKVGASMVVLQTGEIFPALQRGTIDGAFGPISGSLDSKWHDVNKYSLRPSFGYIYQFLFINTNSYAKLSPDVQKVLVDEAAKLEVPSMLAMDQRVLEEEAELKKRGVIHTHLAPAKAEAAIKALIDGIWETAEGSKATGDRAKEFHAFIQQKGLPALGN
jgi:TRAP-type C4-dicarboxylate transport system substrate-binding protein